MKDNIEISATPETDAIKEPLAITNLRAKAVAIATNGSTVIAWPDNRHVIDYIEDLKSIARKLERERNEARKQAEELSDVKIRMGMIASDNLNLLAERDQLRIDIAEIRLQHKQEADGWKTDEETAVELIQLRKVCDELASKYKSELIMIFGHSPDCDCDRCNIFNDYNSLPHVKAKGKE